MALELGNLLGAVGQITTALSEEKSLKTFLDNINNFGIQVKNNFEVNFSGLQDITFFITDVNFSGMHQNFTELYYDGKVVYIPTNTEFDHTGSLTVLNDGSGYIYSAIANFMMNDQINTMVNSGYTMTIKCLTGDEKYKGALITITGVRLESVSGLSFGQSANDVSTFDITFKYIDYTFTPGALSKASGILGGVSQLMGMG